MVDIIKKIMLGYCCILEKVYFFFVLNMEYIYLLSKKFYGDKVRFVICCVFDVYFLRRYLIVYGLFLVYFKKVIKLWLGR